MRPAQKGESRSRSTRALARRLLDQSTPELTGGGVHETQGFDALMELCDSRPATLLGDKGYDSDEIRADLDKRGIKPVIPPRANRGSSQAIPPHRHRYEKTARAYLSMLCIAAANSG